MCTLTWIHERDGYRIFFNRDELLQRGRGLPPSLKRRGAVEYLAPTDPDAGGTWIASNAFGVTICLLNHEAASPAASQGAFQSRGWIVDELADSMSLEQLCMRLQLIDARRFRPFRLAAFDARGKALQATWAGEALGEALPEALIVQELLETDMPLCSSSLDPARAEAERRAQFASQLERRQPDLEFLRAFHRSHEPEPSAWTPCMHRSGARTVSHAEIAVGKEQTEFLYHDGPPCEGRPMIRCTLARIPARVASASA